MAPERVAARGEADLAGRGIIVTAWVANVVFAATSAPFALGVDSWEPVAVGAALVLFAISLVVWVWAFAIAVARSARGDDIAVANLFFLQGSAPKRVRWHLFGALAVDLVLTALFTGTDPFVVLVPMLPIGLCGLWGARHGVFRPRADMVGDGVGAEPRAQPVRPQRAPRAASRVTSRGTKGRRDAGGRAGE